MTGTWQPHEICIHLIYVCSIQQSKMTKLMVRRKKLWVRISFIYTNLNEVAFGTTIFTNTVEECPGCSKLLAYSKKDHFFNEYLFDPSCIVEKQQETQPQ